MGRYEDEILKGLGVSPDDVPEETIERLKTEARYSEERWARTGPGCVAAVFLLIVLGIILFF